MSTFPTDAEREAVRDELAHTTIGTGYYSTTVDIDAAREMTDDVLAALAPLVADRERAAAARTLREASSWLMDLPSRRGPAVYADERMHADGQDLGIELAADHLRDRADALEAGEGRG